MARLDTDRQNKLEPKRMQSAIKEIEKKGLVYSQESEKELLILYNGNWIKYFPYSGWASGKGIKDGRGLKKLLKQLNQTQLT